MRILVLFVPLLLLSGCFGGSEKADLKEFMQATLNKPRGRIEPIPTFKPYEFFSYGAAGLRSPFEPPIIENVELKASKAGSVKPNLDRRKDFLEKFPLGSLAMMGTMQMQDGVLYALIKDGDGSVVKVQQGQYMGQNHGRITAITEERINLIEIVPDGTGGWIERPRTLALDGLVGELK